MTVPLAAQIAEVEREIAMRERVYPAWVRSGKMKQEAADKHREGMEAVLATLRWFEKHEAVIRAAIPAIAPAPPRA